MNYAGRMNSFIFKGGNVLDAIAEYKKMHGLTHLEFNYPEHVEGYDIQELKKAMGDLKVNGLALRWRGSDFLDGDFTHPCEETRRRVIDMCKEAIREVADYAPDMKYSIEYKPYEERSFAMVDSTGMTMYLINEVDRPNVGCTLDFCHMLMKKEAIARYVASLVKDGESIYLDAFWQTAVRRERVHFARCLNWGKCRLSAIKKRMFWCSVATI